MLADVIERQQIETKNTLSFLKYVLGKRAPKEVHQGGVHDTSIMSVQPSLDASEAAAPFKNSLAMPSISTHTQGTEPSFRSPKRLSVMERARGLFGESHHRRPADLIKAQMRQNYRAMQKGYGADPSEIKLRNKLDRRLNDTPSTKDMKHVAGLSFGPSGAARRGGSMANRSAQGGEKVSLPEIIQYN